MADVGGRPSVMDENTIQILEEAFSNGASDLEACFLANISKSTLYNYQNDNPGFLERKEALKDMIAYQAKKVIKLAIDGNDKDMAKWYAERKVKDLKPKQDITTDNKPLPILGGITNVSEDNSTK